MRIDDFHHTPPAPAAEQSDPAASKPSEKNNGSISGSDEAQVSNVAQALATRDPQRIEQLRLEVQSGTYDVSAETVANAIIDTHMRE